MTTPAQSKHTQEEWKLREIDSSKSLIGTKECTIAMVYRNLGSPVTQDRHGQGDANGRLMAMAPQLLHHLKVLSEELQTVKSWYLKNELQWIGSPYGEIEEAKELIARAEGKV